MEIDKLKLEELLTLLEELVINKVRVEKVQNEIKDPQYKKILGTEIQIVTKVQDVIKDIQTSTLTPIYLKLSDLLKSEVQCVEFYGDTSKYDYFNEEHIYSLLRNLIEHILDYYNKNYKKKIKIFSRNDSSNLIIELEYSREHVSFKRLIPKYDKKYFPLTQVPRSEISDWMSELGLSDCLDPFINLYDIAKSFNSDIELRDEDSEEIKVIITIPVSTSIVKAQLAQINNLTYAIPAEYIEKVINSSLAKLKVANNKLFMSYMDTIIPVINIEKELVFENCGEYTGYIILIYNKQMKALPVHSLLDQLDIVVKSKPKLINEVREFKGTTVLGDGNAVMVFDIPYIIENVS